MPFALAATQLLLTVLAATIDSTPALECSTTELSVQKVEECVNAVRVDPEKYAWSYPCAVWGLQPTESLKRNSKLREAAIIHTSDMVKNNFFRHDGSNGSKFSDRVWSTGYTGDTVGENLAVGYRDALSVVGGWMCSETHRANMMTCAFDEFGTSMDCSSGRCYIAQEYGCKDSCCSKLGDTGFSLSAQGGFFSRLLGLGGSESKKCSGLLGCFVSDIIG